MDVKGMVDEFGKEELQDYELTLAKEKDRYPGEHGTNSCFHCKTDIFNAYIHCSGCNKEHNTFYCMCPKCFISQFGAAVQVPGDLTDYGEDMNNMFRHNPGTDKGHKKYVCGFRFYTPEAMETDFRQVWKGCEKASQDFDGEDSTELQ